MTLSHNNYYNYEKHAIFKEVSRLNFIFSRLSSRWRPHPHNSVQTSSVPCMSSCLSPRRTAPRCLVAPPHQTHPPPQSSRSGQLRPLRPGGSSWTPMWSRYWRWGRTAPGCRGCSVRRALRRRRFVPWTWRLPLHFVGRSCAPQKTSGFGPNRTVPPYPGTCTRGSLRWHRDYPRRPRHQDCPYACSCSLCTPIPLARGCTARPTAAAGSRPDLRWRRCDLRERAHLGGGDMCEYGIRDLEVHG